MPFDSHRKMAKNPTWIFQIPAMGSEVWFPGQLWCDAALAGPSLLLSHTHPSGAWNPVWVLQTLRK